MFKKIVKTAAVTAMAALSTFAADVDPKLPVYEKTTNVSGTLNSIGSDTLNNLMTLWAESFQRMYPNVTIQIEGKGSSTAPPALIEGTSQLGPMSRKMKSKETDAFEKKFGYKPTLVGVAIDALAVFVHKDNPVKGLNLQNVDSIFSSTFKFGGTDVTSWGQLGLDGSWKSQNISIYGRNSASGTYGFFKKKALKKGSYKKTVKEQPGSSAVVNSIANDITGIGYSGIGYKTSGVKALPIAKSGDKFVAPTATNAVNGKYPLARVLNVYVNKKEGAKLDKLTAEFLKFVLSKEGQEIVVKDGYYPLPAAVAAQFRKALVD